MKLENIVSIILLVFVAGTAIVLVLRASGTTSPHDQPRPTPTAVTPSSTALASAVAKRVASTPTISESAPARVVAYYFHSTQRCSTCLSIETQAEAVVRIGFEGDCDAGRLEWRVVNLDEPEHEHYTTDFELTHSTVVLTVQAGDEVRQWQRVDEVWEWVGDAERFAGELRGLVAGYLATVRSKGDGEDG